MDYLLTNEGAALMTQAVSGKNLIFTRAEAGTGYSSSPAMLTQVIGSLQTLDMSVTHEGSDVRITCFLTNRELEQGYTLKQLGIYARLAETEADTLVVIGQQYSGEMIHPFADGEAEYEFVILMKASGTSSITVESGAGSLVTKRELNAHVNRMDNPHGVTKEDIGLDKVPNLTVDDMAPSFMEAEKRENVRSGEKSTILWGKVRKWLSDLKSGAFAIIANNCTTTEEGTVLDGRQGKALQEQIVELREADSEINSNMGGIRFGIDVNGNYGYKKAGADTVIPFSSLNLVETSGNIPAGVKKALCISASASDSSKADVRISGNIINASRRLSFLNMIVSGKYTAGATLTELELSGAAGTITVNFTAGAGTQRTGYALFYLK